jgi:hypothetical protein
MFVFSRRELIGASSPQTTGALVLAKFGEDMIENPTAADVRFRCAPRPLASVHAEILVVEKVALLSDGENYTVPPRKDITKSPACADRRIRFAPGASAIRHPQILVVEKRTLIGDREDNAVAS